MSLKLGEVDKFVAKSDFKVKHTSIEKDAIYWQIYKHNNSHIWVSSWIIHLEFFTEINMLHFQIQTLQ